MSERENVLSCAGSLPDFRQSISEGEYGGRKEERETGHTLARESAKPALTPSVAQGAQSDLLGCPSCGSLKGRDTAKVWV